MMACTSPFFDREVETVQDFLAVDRDVRVF